MSSTISERSAIGLTAEDRTAGAPHIAASRKIKMDAGSEDSGPRGGHRCPHASSGCGGRGPARKPDAQGAAPGPAGRRGGQGRGRPVDGRVERLRRARPRRGAPGHRRHRDLPPPPRRPRGGADPHADRPRRRPGPHRRAGRRSRTTTSSSRSTSASSSRASAPWGGGARPRRAPCSASATSCSTRPLAECAGASTGSDRRSSRCWRSS